MIPPGGECEIKVTLRPKGGHTAIDKNVVVFSNDPEQPQFSLTMKGTLLVDIEAVPPSLQMMNLAPGEPGVASLSVERSKGSAATVKSVRVEDSKRFSIREIETRPGALATYEVRFAGGEVGTTTTKVIVETTGEHTPQLTIPVRANAAYNLIYPKRVVFTRSASGSLEENLRISTRRGDPPKIKKVEDLDGLLEIEVLAAVGPRVEIRLRVRTDAMAKLDDGAGHTLWVHTDDPDEPKLEVEYKLQKGVKRRAGRGADVVARPVE
ncbi:MAG: hypothetical protein IAG13_07670 [Deltaproteobacteria bacterium]|nr:hypothetical protein [Nannocystaceae bacterium]